MPVMVIGFYMGNLNPKLRQQDFQLLVPKIQECNQFPNIYPGKLTTCGQYLQYKNTEKAQLAKSNIGIICLLISMYFFLLTQLRINIFFRH